MKFAGILTTIVLVLPTVLGVSISNSANSKRNAALDGDASEYMDVIPPLGYSGYSDLEVRAPGDIQSLESRQVVEVVAAIGGAIGGILKTILGEVQRDEQGRGEFTQKTVVEGRRLWPTLNWVICHPAHTTRFSGEQGVSWGHSHVEFDIKIGGTIGYEVYWFESGTFERHGDGGFLNWAFVGDVASTSNGGATVTFS
ncbi:hypothetical protein DFP72DRAFT_1075827 [Ephemerocybe angulata]|uniref:Uncharacterized protein n=1 Tax=Ephemerocybe angulata TaxID=980116 RepID=A0A8H6LWX5_9AGAR|nr:hypothetical protein DFP72DRAFT_1075827 [Tulosesus angulatus]